MAATIGAEISVPAWKLEVFDEARKLQSECGGFAGADRLHRGITGEHWGITARELQDGFLHKVRQMLAAGKVQNVGRVEYPQKKFDDPAIGPNMYQITDQVIKPATCEQDMDFPGASWALMSNPLGNEVTIFVTHAWAEGVFEFARHVLAKWPGGLGPSGAEHAAYICFLSNPQHLDISEMLRDIETSPFKVALNRMPRPGLMIVTPTDACPIHSRLWCVAELFWATGMQIPIEVGGHREQLAQAGKSHEVEVAIQAARRRRRLPLILLIFAGLVILALIYEFWPLLSGLGSAFSTLSEVSTLSDINATEPLYFYYYNYYYSGRSALDEEDAEILAYFGTIATYTIIGIICCVICCCACCLCCYGGAAFAVARGEVRESAQKTKEAEEHAFSGTLIDVRAASCTVEDDERRIRAAMQGREDEVNQMLGHLIMYGSSSRPTLLKDVKNLRKNFQKMVKQKDIDTSETDIENPIHACNTSIQEAIHVADDRDIP